MAFVSPFQSPFVKPFPSEGAAATQLFYDTFTDADGTNLNLHTPNVDTVGGGWVAYSTVADYQIQSNRAARVSILGGSDSFYCANVGEADVTINAKIITFSGDNSNTGFAVRLSDISNFWLVAFSASADTFNIFQRNGGVYTLRASASVTININTQYVLSCVLSGNSITATLNGGNSISYSSAFNNTATRHGLALRNQPVGLSRDTCDDFEVMP